MAIPYSDNARRQLNATSAKDAIVLLLEISHPGLGQPERVTNNTESVDHLGNTFTALPFDGRPPDDLRQGKARAQLAIDNVGRVLTQWIELTNGGAGASFRLMQVMVSEPDVIEWEVTMSPQNVGMDMQRVAVNLGFKDLSSLPGVALTHRPDTTPAIF